MALWKHAVVGAIALAISGSVLTSVRAEEAAPADKPKVEKAEKKIRLFKPFTDLEGLSEEQKQTIADIRKKTNDEIKEIRDREKAEMLAVLTDDQKAALAQIEEAEAASRKKPKEMKQEPTTKPTE